MAAGQGQAGGWPGGAALHQRGHTRLPHLVRLHPTLLPLTPLLAPPFLFPSQTPTVYKSLYDGVQVVAAKVLTGLSDERMFNAFVREVGLVVCCRMPAGQCCSVASSAS